MKPKFLAFPHLAPDFKQNKMIFNKIFCKIVNLSFFNNFSCKYFEDKKVHHGVNVYLF